MVSPRQGVAMYAMQRRSEWGRKERKGLKLNAASERLCSVVCKRGSPVIKGEAKMNGILMHDSRHRVKREWQGSVSDSKGIK